MTRGLTRGRCTPSWLFAALCAMSLLMASMGAGAGDPASGGLVVFGNFMRINHSGDATGQVDLADLPASQGHWGLGAPAEAALFVWAQLRDWDEVVAPAAMAQAEVSIHLPP